MHKRYGLLEATLMRVFLFQDGRTPLHFASSKGHLPVATLMVDCGAAIEARDKVRHANP